MPRNHTSKLSALNEGYLTIRLTAGTVMKTINQSKQSQSKEEDASCRVPPKSNLSCDLTSLLLRCDMCVNVYCHRGAAGGSELPSSHYR